MNTWLLSVWSGMLCVDCVCVRGVARVYCEFVYWALWLEGACFVCTPFVWYHMLGTSLTRVDCCPLPPWPKCRERAAGTLRGVFAVAYKSCVYACVGMMFDALGTNEYLVVVRVVWDAVR